MFADSTDDDAPTEPRHDAPTARESSNTDALLAALVAASDDAIIGKTIEGTILVWNAGAEHLFGWTAAEAIGRSITLIIPVDRREEEARVVARLVAGEHIRHYQTVRQRKDGVRLDVSLSVSPVRDETGRVTMAVKILRDITRERARATEREQLLAATEAAYVEAERAQKLLVEQALELEVQAAELEVTIEELRTSNDEITRERELAEAARADAERATRTLDAVLDQLPVGVYVADASGRVLIRNRRGGELLGYPPDTVERLADFAKFRVERPDGAPYTASDRPLSRALANQSVEQEIVRYRHPDGSIAELSVSAAPVHDEVGRVIMAVSTFLDVTASRATERAVAEREALLRGFFSAPGLMMLVLELIDEQPGQPRDYRIAFANEEASAWLKSNTTDIVGRTGRSLGMSDEAANRLVRLYEGVWSSKRAVSVELPSATREGGWLRLSVSPITTTDDRARRLGVIMVDVSEEHRREEHRQRLQRLVEHATDFIGVASLALELEYVNPAGLALVHAPSAQALTGRSALDVFEFESVFRLEREVLPAVRQDGSWSGESRMRELDTGASIPVELTMFTITDPITDKPIALAMVGRTIGERQRLQAELRQAQKMEAVGQLAGGVAHDFNNLLSIILSYSVLIAESMPESDPSRADIEEIRLAGERAASLTRQLLAFSRQQVLQPQVVNLNEIVVSTEKMLRRLIGEDVELIVHPAPDLGDALVDPGQIEQVIMNLVVNARDAMPHGGKLSIETANVDLDEAFASSHEGIVAGPHVMLAVTDTGEGMSEATMTRIFEPFFTTKGIGKGTGLGLSTVIGIVQQSGGTIHPRSELGKGTSMKVYLPRTDRAGPRSPVPNDVELARRGGTETVLLVEDEEQVRVVASTILRRYGYHVLEAQSGGDALLVCEQHSATIHLLLTDVIMPRMSGPTLAERLKRIRPELKVLFMSGYTDRAIIDHALFDSSLAFIQKPFTPERLAQKIRDVLDARTSR